MEERLVRFRPRAILIVLGIILAGVVLIEIVQAARGVLIWIFVALFLALALNPAVDWLLAHGVKRRGTAVVDHDGRRDPADRRGRRDDRADDRRAGERLRRCGAGLRGRPVRGQGPLGFLEREYEITDRVREALSEGGASKVLGLSGTALAVTKGVVTAVIATLTITFLTLFMLLEGPPGWSASTACCPRRSSRAGARSAATSTGRSAAT